MYSIASMHAFGALVVARWWRVFAGSVVGCYVTLLAFAGALIRRRGNSAGGSRIETMQWLQLQLLLHRRDSFQINIDRDQW